MVLLSGTIVAHSARWVGGQGVAQGEGDVQKRVAKVV
jgi:hypothetical protein